MEKEELDEGYVTLVNAKEEDGNSQSVKKEPSAGHGNIHIRMMAVWIMWKSKVKLYSMAWISAIMMRKFVLHDIKLYAKPGQKIAFVGSTGAGKTTITNLINRFYDIQDGKIRYDGININKIKKADLRRSLGIVLQDTHLFTGTVRDNIRIWQTGCDR